MQKPVSDERREHMVCDLPWTLAEIHGDGMVYVCCPRFSGGKAIGNIFNGTADEIWNSPQAQAFRAGILDGSYRQCSATECPFLAAGSLPTIEQIRNGRVRADIEAGRVTLASGPLRVKLAHDDSCNLYCASCRNTRLVANKERQEKLDRALHGFILPFLKDATYLEMAGDGDPFGSKHYRDIMVMTAKLYPHLKISLHTNAVLCDEKAWADCALHGRVSSVLVSVDAATAETYAKVRRGGDFERLLRNLRFLSRLRGEHQLASLRLAFVVQKDNYGEMPDFVGLAKDLNADAVDFSLIRYWQRAMQPGAFNSHKVWGDGHPEFRNLLDVLTSPDLGDRKVNLGDVAPLRRRALEVTTPSP